MDQRRLFLFLSLCFVLMVLFGPKQKPPQKPGADKAAQLEQAGEAEEAKANAALQPNQPAELPAEVAGEADFEEAVEADLEYVTLGSADPDSPYRLLITLTNQGAGVRRIELSSPRFRDLHDRGGYVGHLELATDETSGLLVQALGAGTPAAAAGLEVGDRIVSYTAAKGQKPLATSDEFAKLLRRSKPKRQLTLQVARGKEEPVNRVITLGRRPLEVIRPEAENVLMRVDKLPDGITSPPSFQFTFEQLGAAKIPETAQEIVGLVLRDSNWEIAQRDATRVSFRKNLPKYGVEVFKHYQIEPVPEKELKNKNYPGYNLSLELEIRNRGEQTLPLRYRLDGPNGLPTEGWWYANKIGRSWTVGIRDVIARHLGKKVPEQFGAKTIADGDAETMQGPPLSYAGIDAQYFSVMLLPQKPSLETLWIDELRSISLSPKPKGRSIEGRYVNVTCRLISQELKIEPGETLKHAYQIFAGPKRPDLLEKYQANESAQYSLSDLSYYGWFSTVAKGMLWILHFFYGIFGNYGIAIIMLTVLVKSCMFPISRKQAQSMAKMQELRPEMDKIKEKYKQDMQKQSQATQELYRKHNINPVAGCLPLFIQMPIFLGLYRGLMVDVELRQAPLLGDAVRWCSNLAAPDMLFNWSSFMPAMVTRGETALIGLGPYLNVFPLATAGLILLQQRMFMPKPQNEQAAMQQNVMKYMMPVMGLLFFKVAAGLCLYFIASSIWGIAERKMLPKPAGPDATTLASTATTPSKSSSSSSREKSSPRRKKKSKKKKK